MGSNYFLIEGVNCLVSFMARAHLPTSIQIVVPEVRTVPTSLWWLDPTLPYKEIIPMYALLMAVDNHYSSYNTTDQAEVLDEAFTMGRLLRGRPFDEWRHTIHTGLVIHCRGHSLRLVVPNEVPLQVSRYDIAPGHPRPIGPSYKRGQLQGLEIASKWLQALDYISYVLQGGTNGYTYQGHTIPHPRSLSQ